MWRFYQELAIPPSITSLPSPYPISESRPAHFQQPGTSCLFTWRGGGRGGGRERGRRGGGCVKGGDSWAPPASRPQPGSPRDGRGRSGCGRVWAGAPGAVGQAGFCRRLRDNLLQQLGYDIYVNICVNLFYNIYVSSAASNPRLPGMRGHPGVVRGSWAAWVARGDGEAD